MILPPPAEPPPPCTLADAATDAAAGHAHVRALEGQLWRRGEPYRFVGVSMWYAANLGAHGLGGDRERLEREIDHLKRLGVNNVRLLAGSEGPDYRPTDVCADWCEPDKIGRPRDHCIFEAHAVRCGCVGCDFCHVRAEALLRGELRLGCPKHAMSAARIVPSAQPTAGVFSEAALTGLDHVLSLLAERDMTAIVVVGNMLPWSGGLAAYVSWVTKREAYVEGLDAEEAHQKQQNFVHNFWDQPDAQKLFATWVQTLLTRTNTVNGRRYNEDEAVLAWELVHNPTPPVGKRAQERYAVWIRSTVQLIRSLDCAHLIALGSEQLNHDTGEWGHHVQARLQAVDLLAVSLFSQRRGFKDDARASIGAEAASIKGEAQLQEALAAAKALGKPLIVESVGFGRDGGGFELSAGTRERDGYFGRVCVSIRNARPRVAGLSFWAWGGEGRPRKPKAAWAPGDAWTGDPPNVLQGMHSIYDADNSTLEVIKACTRTIARSGTEEPS